MHEKLDMVVFETAGSTWVIPDTTDTDNNRSLHMSTDVDIWKLLGIKKMSIISDQKDTMTKISSVIDDEISKFEDRNLEVSILWEKEQEHSNQFLFAAGLRETNKGTKREWVRAFSAKPVKRGSRFRVYYTYGRE